MIIWLKLGPGHCHDSPVTSRTRRTRIEGAEVGEVLHSLVQVCGLCYCLGETRRKVIICRGFSTSRSCHTTCLSSMSTVPGLYQRQKQGENCQRQLFSLPTGKIRPILLYWKQLESQKESNSISQMFLLIILMGNCLSVLFWRLHYGTNSAQAFPAVSQAVISVITVCAGP